MDYFDLHADTPHRLFHDRRPEALHIPPRAPAALTRYRQVFAFFADERLSDDAAYADILAMHAEWQSLAAYRPYTAARSVEDLRVLNGSLSRLTHLLSLGFSVFTPLWEGESCIGGAWDTDAPLTPFGETVAHTLARQGALLDISHASPAAAEQLLTVAAAHGRPVLSTHSASFSVTPHPRNLSDEAARRVIATGGLIGLPLVGRFLTNERPVRLTALLPHIEHMLSLGAGQCLCLGLDLDGTTDLPQDFHSINDIYLLAELIAKEFSPAVSQAVCWENAARFFSAQPTFTR